MSSLSHAATSITGRLMLLIAATTIPLSLLGAGILYADYLTDRTKAERQLVRQAQTIALLVDQDIERAQDLARAVAASTALERGDIASFRSELLETTRTYGEGMPLGAQPVMIGLAGLDGNWITDTGPLGGTGQHHPAPEHMRQTLASGQPHVSDLYIGSITGQPRISVSVPVFAPFAAGETSRSVVGAIGVAISRNRFIDTVDATRLPPRALASILDRRGVTIARSVHDAETVGKLPNPTVLDAILHNQSGLAPSGAKSLDGVPSTIAYAHAPKSGFIAKLDVPEALFLAPFRASLLRTAAVGLLVLAFGLGLAAMLARRLVVALRRVVPAAQAAAQPGAALERLGLPEADDVARELTRVLVDQRAEAAALEASEATFRTVANALPQLVWAADASGRFYYFNARCHEFTGIDQLDAESWRSQTHPDDLAALDAHWLRALATGQPFEVEARRRRHDGQFRWMLVRTVPIRSEPSGGDHSFQVIRWFGSSTDITDIVDAREVAARGRADLERLIEERTRDLRHMQARLAHAARTEALGQLAGGIAHDFNNVLQAVLGGSALIERQSADPVLVVKHARMVFESAERGAAITRRLLAFSHRSALRAETIDPVALLSDIQGILAHTLGAAIQTEIAAPADLPNLLADKGQLETVLINLATNARDAMDGRGTIQLGAALDIVDETPQLHHAGLNPGAYIRLWVEDSGIGMDAATLGRAIEPFFTTKPTGQGTGLGLAMAHGFAGQSGGSLHIRSAPGQGATVTLWLPLATAINPSDPKRERSGDDASLPSPALILLVDDEPLVRDVVDETLRIQGYEVVAAASAEQALIILQSAPVKLLITDLSMPGMDGVSLIHAAQLRRPGLPAILVTGYARDETDLAMSGAVSGSFSVLRKPVTSAQLCGRVADLLQAVTSHAEERSDQAIQQGRADPTSSLGKTRRSR